MRTASFIIVIATGTMTIVSSTAQSRTVVTRDKEVPLRIDAKSVAVHEREKTAIFSDAHVSQGDMRMQCRSLIARYAGETIQQLECEQ
jgi:lipopolysaccharide export system protein LptA